MNKTSIKKKHRIEEDNNLKGRKIKNTICKFIFLTCTLIALITLIMLMSSIMKSGIKYLNIDFLTSFPSRFASRAGILPALVGSIYLIFLTALISFPIGIGTAIYLEEYMKKSKLKEFLELNISNLAGVPSIVYGMLGLGVFAVTLGRGVLTGALTLSLLILPTIIITTEEALRNVPIAIKEGSYALGVSKWQSITGVILPYAMPNILTGSILSISRALGESAPLIMVGALSYVAFLPEGITSSYTALPIQIYNWTSRPQAEFQDLAAAGIIVLLVILLTANSIAILLRNKYNKNFH
ncbi:MAG: phosphate ABC transporter permease PstA [Clostridium argentinense]|uniref:Phosphate transport system permease protein PstA n=1 Tax=Clostridium faecium TaxID=2762223 RepID=A0ABR8YQ62_9CLOT|nr:phosphate ABC transporter permease PstA [Clostridium faecium]MBS5823640.1 phosphate ABC transporter permease PstA [Clostridium argentinense]